MRQVLQLLAVGGEVIKYIVQKGFNLNNCKQNSYIYTKIR